MDNNIDFPVGNINTNSIMEVFEGEAYKKYRLSKKKDLTPCNQCSME